MRQRKRYEFLLEAQSPIAHHEGAIGNHATLMRRKVRTSRGFEDVPIVTADTMRHKLREASSLALLDAADMGEATLTESALRLLFNGGMVTGSDGGAVKLDAYRELVTLIPSLALFGGCAQNRIIPGQLTVEDAMLICTETEHYFSPWQVTAARKLGEVDTHSAYVENVQRVRMDSMLNPSMRKMLTEGEQVRVAGQLTAGERASAAGDDVERQANKSKMLPRTFECIARGSLLGWAVEALVSNELEEDVFNVSVLAFLSRAVVGGKSGTGHGQLRVVAANEVQMRSPAREHEALDTTALGLRVGQVFRAHVEARREQIQSFFATCSA
jgi:hypothetical protein